MERYTKKQSPNSSALATYETNTETFEKSESLKADKWKNKVLFQSKGAESNFIDSILTKL
jgi:hypothetical protein